MSFQGAVSADGQPSLATSGEFEIVTASVYMMLKKSSWWGKDWSIKHMTTTELVRPLAIPGGPHVLGDDESLYRDHFTTELVDGRTCTYCNSKALGAATFQQDHVPWKRYAGQILGIDPSPVR